MLNDISLLKIYGTMAKHSSVAQEVSATNIANANQPGYKAQKVESFEAFMARVQQDRETIQSLSAPNIFEAANPAKPNGNTVSLEQEVMSSAQALGQHNLALSVYSKSLEMMRTALGRR